MSENFTNQSVGHCTVDSSPLYRSGTALGCTDRSTVVRLCPRISFTSQWITVQEVAYGIVLGCTDLSTVVLLCPRISPNSQGITIQEVARLCIILKLFLVVQALAHWFIYVREFHLPVRGSLYSR